MTTTTAAPVTTTVTRRPGRALNVILWVGQVLFAAAFLFAGGSKLLGAPEQIQSFQAIGFGQWFRYLTGACEVGGAIGLLIPRLAGPAALGLVGVMIGATLTNLFLLPGMAPVAVVTVILGVLFALIARARWSAATPVLALLRH